MIVLLLIVVEVVVEVVVVALVMVAAVVVVIVVVVVGMWGAFFDWGAMVCLCPPPLLTPHFYFPLELYVCITLTNNYLVFFIYQLIILWTISIN